jgi:3alpha(or 20beta)-hydroxysteroid dehydrogenase
MRFEEKIALVTGSAGGIGRATVERFARGGAKIVATDLAGASLDALKSWGKDSSAEVLVAAHDVTQWSDWERVVAEAVARFGGIDFLVNNAGIEGPVATIDALPPDALDAVLDVNVKGTFLGMKACIPEFRKRGGGAIVNLSSIAGVMGDSMLAPYVASKHAVIGLTKSVAMGHGAEKIRANAVCPAPIETRMMRSLESSLSAGSEDVIKQAFEQRIPLGRYGTPDEVAGVICFLCSEDADFVSGSIYTVDGGMTNY